jgi:hypothetical protein
MGAHAGPAGYKNRPPHTHREKFYFPIERKNKILVKVRLHFFERKALFARYRSIVVAFIYI